MIDLQKLEIAIEDLQGPIPTLFWERGEVIISAAKAYLQQQKDELESARGAMKCYR